MRNKSPIQIPICDATPTAPSRGNISLFSKADGVYTVDETGEEKKLGSGGEGGGSVPTDFVERVEKLENQQKRVNVELVDDLTTLEHINTLNKLRILDGEMELIKSSNAFEEEFDTNDIIDETASLNVTTKNGQLVIEDTLAIVVNGMMTTKVIDVEATDTITLTASEIKPDGYAGDTEVYREGKQWVCTSTDSKGNIWVFSADHRQYTANVKIELNIFDETGNLIKTTEISTGTTKYCLMFGGKVSFDMFGNAYLMATLRDDRIATGTHAGFDGDSHSSNNPGTITTGLGYGNATINLTFIFNSAGELLKTMHKLTSTYNYSYFRGLGVVSNPDFIFSPKGYAVRLNSPVGTMFTGGSNTSSSVITASQQTNKDTIEVFTVSNTGELTKMKSVSLLTTGSFTSRFTFNWSMFLRGEDIYILYNNEYQVFALGDSYYKLIKLSYDNGVVSVEDIHTFETGKRPFAICGGINGAIYNRFNDCLYVFTGHTNTLKINRFRFTDTGLEHESTKQHTLEKSIYHALYCQTGIATKFIVQDDLIHIAYPGSNEGGSGTSLRYMSIDFNGNIVTQPSLVAYHETLTINHFNMQFVGGELVFSYGFGSTSASTGITEMAVWKPLNTDISYEILNVATGDWYDITNGDTITLNSPTEQLKVRTTLTSPQYRVTPAVERLVLEYATSEDKANTVGEMTTKRLPSVSSSGRGVLTAEYELNEGTVDWFVSFDGGVTWKAVQIGYEFLFNYVDAPDFRVKAVLQIPSFNAKSPVVRSYTLRTDSVVLHSDIEEIQVNLMKTNFKIDTFTNATRNDMIKMTIDTFADDAGIDYSLSDCTFNRISCSVGGNVVVSTESNTSSTMNYILLTSDEMLPYTDSYVEYYISRDSGATYTKIDKDVKCTVPKPSSGASSTIRVKAMMYNGAELNAWAWAWN